MKTRPSTLSRITPALCIIAFFSLVFVGAVDACPTCKDGIAQSPNQAALIRGYQASIIFMMSMPFLILTILGSYFYYEICKARREQRVAATAEG